MAFTTLAEPTANASLPPSIDPPLRQTGNTVLAIDLGTTVGWALLIPASLAGMTFAVATWAGCRRRRG